VSGSSDRMPAYQEWGPELKPQYHQKIKSSISLGK
jgi:hypothetical protein